VLLEAAVAAPDTPLAALPLMPREERQRVLEAWNRTGADYPRGGCIHDLFAAQAARTPGAVALRFREEEVTYAALDARANRLAHRLRRLGVGPDVPVAVCMERTPDLVVSLFAVLKAGGGYVPVDPAYPAERIAYMLQDSGAPVLLTQAVVAERIPEHAGTTVRVDEAWDRSPPSRRPRPVAVGPRNLAYAIYTSGSTGRPKGVAIEHRSTVVLLHWLREHVSDEERRAVLGSTSVSFDVSVAEIFGTLCWGGTLVLVRNALELAELPADAGIVLASMAPSAAAELLRTGGIPASVRVLNLGGEALPAALAQAAYATGTVERVVNLYGPTEDTTYTTHWTVPRGAERVMVGRPVANTRLYVLDRHLQPVPAGDAGRAVRDRRGALARLPPPAGADGGAVRPLPVRGGAGGADVPGGGPGAVPRRRGARLPGAAGPPGEDPRPPGGDRRGGGHDRRAPGGAGGRGGGARGRARRRAAGRPTWSPRGKRRLDAGELREFLAARLPDYMVPPVYVPMEKLPLSPNGKVDRLRLPAPELRERRREYVAPRTDTEEALGRIWESLLEVEKVEVESWWALHDATRPLRDPPWRSWQHSLLARPRPRRRRGGRRTGVSAPTPAAPAAAVQTRSFFRCRGIVFPHAKATGDHTTGARR
jgi:amino acid adenylation domain-containing protein